jgi:exopolyphosphatase/guanosine-5'-triphosphate,3'-diphosphate pyrophosphatase
MATIIPRWEWRTFGARFGAADDAFAAMTPTGVQESDELYLLSGAGDNVKVRDDLMDIKVLVGRRQGVRGAPSRGAIARS